MPETGLLPASEIAVVSGETDAPPPPWQIGQAVVQQITFEIRVPQARAALPELVTRSAPTYAKIAVIDRLDSPVGPYREALLMAGCRVGIIPAQYIVAAVVNTEAAQSATAAHWGYQPDVGEIEWERDDGGLRTRIAVNDHLSVSVESPIGTAAATAIVRYDPLLTVQPHEGSPTPHEIPTEHEVTQAWMARASTLSLAGATAADRDNPWVRLRMHNPITAVVAEESQQIDAPAAILPPGG